MGVTVDKARQQVTTTENRLSGRVRLEGYPAFDDIDIALLAVREHLTAQMKHHLFSDLHNGRT